MKTKTFILVLCSFFVILFTESDTEAGQSQTNQFNSYLRQGIDKAFNLETDDANEYIKKAVELEPENPVGYAYLAMLNLISYEMSFELNDRDAKQEALLHYAKEAIKKGLRIILMTTRLILPWHWLKSPKFNGRFIKNIISL